MVTRTPTRTVPDRDAFADAAEVFQLLSTPGRLHLLWLLSNDEVDVTPWSTPSEAPKRGSASTWPSYAWPAGSTDDETDDESSTTWSTPTS